MQFYCSSRIIFEFWIPSQHEENSPRVDKIGSEWFEGIPVKLWFKNVEKTWKMQFYSSSRIIYEIWIPPKIEEFSARVDKIGLGWFGVIPVKLWSENVEKNENTILL